MSTNRTLTGVNAVVKRNGQALAFITGMRINESIRRGSVQGLGRLNKQEVPPVSIDCTISIDFYNTSMRKSAVPGAISREAPGYKDFFENLLLQDGVRLDLFKSVEDSTDPNTGLKSTRPEIFASISNMFIDGDSMSVNEGQVSSRSQSFQYLDPILFKGT